MQNMQQKPILFQINDTLKVLSGLLGYEVTLEELIKLGEDKPVQKLPTVKTQKTRKTVQRPLTTPTGIYSKKLKKVRPEPGDVMINAVRKGKAYRYLGAPSNKDMLNGPVTLFLNFTDTNVVRKFKNSLRASARVDGFGLKIRHLAYNRITVELGDINHEYHTKRFKSEA